MGYEKLKKGEIGRGTREKNEDKEGEDKINSDGGMSEGKEGREGGGRR